MAEDDRDGQIAAWVKLPAYLARLLEIDPRAVVQLRTDTTGRASAIFICPSFPQDAFSRMRPFIAVDGAFIKIPYTNTS